MKIDRDFCFRAVAYLKVMDSSEGEPQIILSQADSPVLKSIGHGLLVAYVVDEGDTFKYVQNRHLEESGITADHLHRQGLDNLRKLASDNAQVRQHGNIFAVLMGGNFEASLILCDDFWTEWYGHVTPQGVIAAFPARDLLAFGDASSPKALSELQGLCKRAAEHSADHQLSSQVFTRIQGAWEPYNG